MESVTEKIGNIDVVKGSRKWPERLWATRAVVLLVVQREGKALCMTVEDENPRVVIANLVLAAASLTVWLIFYEFLDLFLCYCFWVFRFFACFFSYLIFFGIGLVFSYVRYVGLCFCVVGCDRITSSWDNRIDQLLLYSLIFFVVSVGLNNTYEF